MRHILGNMRRTIQENDMILDNDRVAVGLSGGKDSMTLLFMLKNFQRFSPIKYDLEAILIDLGFETLDITATENFCNDLGIKLHIEKTNIARVVFEARNEKNPCSLCANMRRGALATVMKRENLNVLALGHHNDDAIETLFMNLLYAGKINTFEKKAYLSRSDIHVVRPLINVSESEITSAVRRLEIPVTKSPCPMDKNTTREKTKKMLDEIYSNIPNSRKSIINAMKNKDQFKLWF